MSVEEIQELDGADAISVESVPRKANSRELHFHYLQSSRFRGSATCYEYSVIASAIASLTTS